MHSIQQRLSIRRLAGSPLRELAESVVLLALAVLLFRTFAAEGYLISTGSMAPTLLGYHRRVECPACQFHLARGAAFDQSTSTGRIAAAYPSRDQQRKTVDLAETDSDSEYEYDTHCPNCGLEEIPVRNIPRNEGDQLLVQKLTYQFRDPRRWEVVVFQNQQDHSEAYVKRVVGLPGERVQVRDGDVYINGAVVRKPFEVQQALRIPVHDYLHQPVDGDPDWRPRWTVQRDQTEASAGEFAVKWSLLPERLVFDDGDNQPAAEARSPSLGAVAAAAPEQPLQWVLYEHWIRTGGDHVTKIPLSRWPVEIPLPEGPTLRYEEGQLSCLGTLSAFEYRMWHQRSDDPDYRAALDRLFEQSHIAPIHDDYGYNSSLAGRRHPQHDLMLSLTIPKLHGSGRLELQMTDGADLFYLEIMPASRRLALYRNEDLQPLWDLPWPEQAAESPITVDFSLFDQQVLIAWNGKAVAPGVSYTPNRVRAPLRRPVRIGAGGLQCEISELMLYRDVYYTNKGTTPDEGTVLGEDQFFVLGDNSPVSLDSRVWENPAISRRSLIGKPFVVHLPSRQGRIRWQGNERYVRIPDFSRIRYIH